MDRRDGSDCGYGRELEEIDRPLRRLTEEPLNRDNAFIIAALSFIPRAGGGPPPSPLSFYAFLAAKDPLSSSCRWVPSAGRYQCLYAARVGGWMGFVKVPPAFPLPPALYACSLDRAASAFSQYRASERQKRSFLFGLTAIMYTWDHAARDTDRRRYLYTKRTIPISIWIAI